MTLNVTLNDLSLTLPLGSTLTDAIDAVTPQLQIAPPFAASVNGGFVSKARHAQHALKTGDRIALVQSVVGGQESLMTTMNLLAVTDLLRLYDETFSSRLLLGTAHYPSSQSLEDIVRASNPAMLAVALRRQSAGSPKGDVGFWEMLHELGVPVLPDAAGCYSADEAYTLAQMSREVFETDWTKLEVIGDDYTLQSDTLTLPVAAERLIRDGFKVLPYCIEDLVLCRRLLDVGCQALIPWAAPIGTGRGPTNPYGLRLLRKRLPNVPLIVDAGLGVPSHATQVMEWGYDAALLNTAVAQADDPVAMAQAFALAAQAGRLARLSGPIPECDVAQASTPVVGLPFWHAEERSA